MRREYDLTKLSWKRNPYAARLKRLVTMRLDCDVLEYFKKMSARTGLSYQRLINLYLRECARARRRLDMRWVDAS